MVREVFYRQYQNHFGAVGRDELEPEDFYLTREKDGEVQSLLHAQKILENIHINALAVAEPYQGQGLGSELIRELESVARDKGASSITLSTKSYQAKDFYLKMAYEMYASLDDVPRKGLTNSHFIKRL
ncbi:GNAT family N-acetyltransferase [Streptococcus suis]|uniref:GNAT family N-acetyltransferase n=1 Tax=Streptococcus suis TaxID=1307 RepID=UPI000CF373C2|nr:GNAT family N-acetyltransferase [Streptococcus suis]MBY4960997.1 GNAT family N-acetyltransferase [Streptococcus suis]MBY6289313.1 GNAT family N-acetyltransferase [Streptococcus suis]MBY6296468.1 GNAT family N-acetyltransferase [Streptococcus suis]MCK4022024.1 GNAT family N-acetyltransferase [Streptococcus suis]HEM4814049.1 GNAT family N-acetyltransferase [Streptococcus suis]